MNMYISKYASTKGILTVKTTDPEPTDAGKLIVFDDYGSKFTVGLGCFETLDEARLDAIKRTRKKVSLLVKKEQKLEDQISVWESELPS